jgi:predicted HTH transcriptional regulator
MKHFSIKSIFAICTTLLLLGCTTTQTTTEKHSQTRYQSVNEKEATLVQKGKQKNYCIICGMDLKIFYKTSHTAETKNKTKKQYCSLHCVVHDNEINKTDLLNLKVVDTNTLKLIPANSAFYVVGSSKPATMSSTSKYAFSKKADAKKFSKQFGGKVKNFYNTYTIAMKDFSHKD